MVRNGFLSKFWYQYSYFHNFSMDFLKIMIFGPPRGSPGPPPGPQGPWAAPRNSKNEPLGPMGPHGGAHGAPWAPARGLLIKKSRFVQSADLPACESSFSPCVFASRRSWGRSPPVVPPEASPRGVGGTHGDPWGPWDPWGPMGAHGAHRAHGAHGVLLVSISFC